MTHIELFLELQIPNAQCKTPEDFPTRFHRVRLLPGPAPPSLDYTELRRRMLDAAERRLAPQPPATTPPADIPRPPALPGVGVSPANN